MKIKQLLDAQKGIQQIQSVNIHGYRKRYELFRLCKAVQEQMEWYAAEEMRLIERHGGEIEAEGRIKFPDSSAAAAFERERRDLAATEVELGVPLPVQLRETDLAGEALPVEAMLCLDGLVEFVEVGYGGK